MHKRVVESVCIMCVSIGILLLFPLCAYTQTSQNKTNDVINLGFRLGYNALSTANYEVYSGDTKLINDSYTNRTGYSLSGFLRINLDRFFLQPEIGWNVYKQTFSFSLPLDIENNWTAPYQLSKSTQAVAMNILVGYNLTKNDPFSFNLFIGPALKYNYYSKYESDNLVFKDFNTHYNTYGTMGFSFAISSFYADVRYEISIIDTDIDFGEISEAPEHFAPLLLRKNENILSFACGMFF